MKLVYVHLGERRPNLLWKNIDRSRQLFPEINHEVIFSSDEWIAKANSRKITAHKYVPKPEIDELLKSMDHNKNFRGGFWRYSLERILALTTVFENLGNDSVIHIESDILLLPNFPWKSLSSLRKPSWFNFNESHDVASILYLPDRQSAMWLEETIIDELSKNLSLTDMTVLSKISRNHSSKVDILPTAPSSNASFLREFDLDAESKKRISLLFHDLNGFFDSAPVGMWLAGQDPRNHFGRTLLHKELPESYVQPQNLRLHLNETLGVLTEESTGITIYSLHIHSKNMKLFGKHWARELNKFISLAGDTRPIQRYNIRAFTSSLLDSIKRHKFNTPILIVRLLIKKLSKR